MSMCGLCQYKNKFNMFTFWFWNLRFMKWLAILADGKDTCIYCGREYQEDQQKEAGEG